ncbi:class I SAM-dependent methyltransferase [Sedimentibacter sp. zth1]|uniref:class I SAM-dependent methyltransferase n=1 Tax=Sedimentibacter sp. zth1 TaxID=2816908 RepID=UPI001A922058|nr:class I SAM-dependent methyltransferase [Sedimentibacter sp. zth1]QSX04642.1 class I SAM-dependent methyltransferase [Sedimentibacter sp. zth1]
MNLYETPALFNQNMSKEQQDKFLKFYKEVFNEYNITTIHDCSIGAGGTTLPLAKLGYKVSGSDLSKILLDKAKDNFSNEGYDVELFESDFRNLKNNLDGTYDCIISTGNSLPHINNTDVESFVKSIYSKLNSNGLLYIDIRNWDKLLSEKPIFSVRDPLVMTKEEHTSLYLIYNWHDDNSVDFVFATSTDILGKNERVVLVNSPTYYPLEYKVYEKVLKENGFIIKKCFDVDYLWSSFHKNEAKTGNFDKDFDRISWYGILAQKKG